MKKEEQELLLKTICEMLPYGLYAQYYDVEDVRYENAIIEGVDVTNQTPEILIDQYGLYIDKAKPYLRPMSNMTEEEKIEYRNLHHTEKWKHVNNVLEFDVVYSRDIPLYIDWLNAHYFDYHGLIEMGLAIEAPEGMYSN